jgi:hypothetical protein
MRLLLWLTATGLVGFGLGLLCLAAEKRRRCPCGEPVSEPLSDYCAAHEWTYRSGAERGILA